MFCYKYKLKQNKKSKCFFYLHVIVLRGGSYGSNSFVLSSSFFELSGSGFSFFSVMAELSGEVITALLDELRDVSDARELARLNAPDDRLSAML